MTGGEHISWFFLVFFFFFQKPQMFIPCKILEEMIKLDNLAELRKGVVILWASTGACRKLQIAVRGCMNKNTDSSLKNTKKY